MKFKMLFGIIMMLLTVAVVQAVQPVEIQSLAESAGFVLKEVHANLCMNDFAYVALTAPVIVSAKITPELINDLKVKFGTIKLITVVVEEAVVVDEKEVEPAEQYQFLVKRPDRSLIKMLLPLAERGQLDEFADKAVKNLVVGGDMEKLDDGIVFMGVVSQLKTMIAPAQSFLSKA